MKDLINKFTQFLDYYRNQYGKPASEISKPKPNDETGQSIDLSPLVSSDYIMLDFDSMCADANFYPKRNKDECNRPSTVDALYYRLIEEDKIEFYLVEFKSFDFDWRSNSDFNSSLNKVLKKIQDSNDKIDNRTQIGINRLNNIRETYGNTIEFSLRIKPYESLFVVLPKIYDEYCQKKGIKEEAKIDLYEFYKSDSCIIKLIIVGKKNENINKAYLGKLGGLLEKQYMRLDYVNVLTPHDHRECFEWEFELIAELLDLSDKTGIRSLNNLD